MEEKKFRILLITEDEDVAQSIASISKSSENGWEIRWVGSREAAENLLRERSFAGILLDLRIFGFEGNEAVRWLREHAPVTPFVVLSSEEGPCDMHEMMEAGAVGCIPLRHLGALPAVLDDLVYKGSIIFERTHVENILSNLYDIAVEVLKHKDEKELLETATRKAAWLLGSDGGSLYIWSPERRALVLKVTCDAGASTIGTELAPGEGLAGKIFLRNEPMSVRNYSTWEGRSPKYRGEKCASIIGVPIQAGSGKPVGVLEVSSFREREFSESDLHALELMSQIVSIGLENIFAARRWQEQADVFRRVAEEMPKILMELDPDLLLTKLATFTKSILKADKAGALMAAEGDTLQWVYSEGLSEKYKAFIKEHHTIMPGERALAGMVIQVPDTTDESIHPIAREAFREEGIASYVVLPIVTKSKRLTGAITLYRTLPVPFLEHEIHLAEILANNVSVALDNADLFSIVERGKKEWESTFDALEEGVMLLDKDLTVLRINKTQARMIGMTVREAVGKKCYRIMCREEKAPEHCPLLEAIRGTQPVSREIRYDLFGEGIHEVEVVPVVGEKGITGLVRVDRDITEKRELEERVRERERYLANIVNSSGDAIFGVSADGTIMSWNPAAERIFGYRAEEVIGKSQDSFFGGALNGIWPGVLGGRIVSRVVDASRKNGTPIKIFVTASPLLDREGETVGASVIIRDMTQRIRIEWLMRRLNAAALALVNADAEDAVLGILSNALAGEDVSNAFLRIDNAGIHVEKAALALGCQLIPEEMEEALSQPSAYRQIVDAIDSEASRMFVDLSQVFPRGLGKNAMLFRVQKLDGETLMWLLLSEFLSEDYLPTLSAFADLANSTLERVRWEQETQNYLVEMERLNLLAELGTAAIPLQERLKKALNLVLNILQADVGGLASLHTYRGEISPVEISGHGLDEETMRWLLPLAEEAYSLRKDEALGGKKPYLYKVMDLDEIVASGYRAIPPEMEVPRKLGLKGNLLAFLEAGGEPVGVLYLGFRDVEVLRAHRKAFVETLLRQLGLVVRETTLLAQLKARARRLQQTHDINSHLAVILDEGALLEEAVGMVSEMIEGSMAQIALVDEEKKNLVVRAVAGRSIRECGTRGAVFPLSGKGLMVYSALHGETLMVRDVSKDPRYLECVENVRSEMVVPILSHGTVLGVLDMQFEQADAFDDQDAILLEDVARQIASSLENARLLKEERRRRQEAENLRDAALAMSTALERDKVIDLILSRLQMVVPYDTASVQLLHDDTLEIIGGRGFRNLSNVLGIKFGADSMPNAQVIRTRQPVILEDAPKVYESFRAGRLPERNPIRSWMGVPMVTGERVVGMITLDKQEPNFYKEEHARTAMAFAAQAAVAIENARLYEELRNANEELKEALRLREELVQNVSHELRTPLALIRGYAELLLAGSLGKLSLEQERALQVMVRRSQDLSAMVDDLLMLKSPIARSIERDMLDLKALVDEIVDEMSVKAQESGVTFVKKFTEKPVMVWGNKGYLQRVMNNLLDNAIKFSPDGGAVEVSVQVASADGEEEAMLTVKDNGIGIPPEKLDRIFERFYQVDGSTTRRFGGAGIGLALVKEIVAAHGGRVWAESEGIPGKGATLYVVLPLASGKGPGGDVGE